jgi:hypothetical protein
VDNRPVAHMPERNHEASVVKVDRASTAMQREISARKQEAQQTHRGRTPPGNALALRGDWWAGQKPHNLTRKEVK